MPRETLLDRVTAALGHGIVGGVHPVGEALPREDALCAQHGVGRSVVREAVRQLVAKGMLTTHRRGGTRVTEREGWNFLDPDVLNWTQATDGIGRFLDKLFQLRMALEPSAAALAAARRDPASVAAIRAAFGDMAAATTSIEAWISADLRFHQALYLATGNELFWPVGKLFEDALRTSFRVSSAHQHHQHCLPEHEAVLRAIERGQERAAREATEGLLLGADTDVQAVLRSAGETRRERTSDRASLSTA